jgi:hypothetical protein
VPPFISRQLIQRFTTSNPSSTYMSRVTAVFRDNGSGVRGDLAAVLRAVLLDPEARDRTAIAASTTWGKPREENLRALPLLRLLHARSAEPGGGIYDLNPNSSFYGPFYARIGQDAFKAPSVFNFYRPGFIPPLTKLGDQKLVAPELQTLDSLSYTAWSQFLGRSLDRDGTGSNRRDQTDGNTFDGDLRGMNQFDYRDFLAAASDPVALAALVDERLCSGLLPVADRNVLRDQAARISLSDVSTVVGDPTPSATAALFETRSEVGMRFVIDVPGTVRAIRYYRPAGETGSHTGRIWAAHGTQLAQVAFTGETASGWQTQTLPSPLPVLAGQEYVVSVNVNKEYAITPGDVAVWPNGVIRLPSDGNAQGRTSVYPLEFPGLNVRANHFRDVVFRPDSPAVASASAARIRVKRLLFLTMMHPAFLIQK